MNTYMTGFRWFSKMFAFLCFGRKNSLSIGRVKPAPRLNIPPSNILLERMSGWFVPIGTKRLRKMYKYTLGGGFVFIFN